MDNHVLDSIWAETEERVSAGWPALQTYWDDWFSIKLTEFPAWDELYGFREARNAIVHGLGHLTRTQTRRGKSVARLRNARIVIDDGIVLLGDEDVERCANLVVDFITWLDGEIAQA